jgi:perosamine synthetase
MKKIPVCEPLLSGKELEYVTDCIKTNWISSGGKYIDEFEKGFAKYCGVRHGISVSNGTTSLHLALASLGLGAGDEVIMPAFTIASTAFASVYCGAKPVLVDCERDTWNMDVSKLAKKITKKTKAIMPVHMYGQPCDMDPIIELAEKHDLFVVEDAAEVHGAEYKGRKAGSMGDIGSFSFYSNKIITTGEGGMLLTNDDEIAEKARSLKNLAHSKEKRFLHYDIGFNYRMTNIQAAIGLAQLEKIDDYVKMRRNNAKLYSSLLTEVEGLTLPVERKWAKNVYWMYSLLVEDGFGISKDKLAERLEKKGVETRNFFIPMNEQPVFKEMGLFKGEKYPVSEEISRRGFYLPSGSGLSEEQITYVCDSIKEIKKKI